jgi:hypothetical protein
MGNRRGKRICQITILPVLSPSLNGSFKYNSDEMPTRQMAKEIIRDPSPTFFLKIFHSSFLPFHLWTISLSLWEVIYSV